MGRQSRLKQERREAAARGAEEGRRRGCLICRRTDGGFSAQEHIIPESLGNTTKILPVGVVCDRCNNGVCSQVDNALCNFFPIQLMRTSYRQQSKSGKLPSVRFDNGSIEATGPSDVSLWLSSAKWQRDLPAPPGYKSFSFTAKRHDLTPERLSKVHRGLVKQALEFAWLDLGEERALSAEFDRERDLILHGGHQGYISTVRTIKFGDDIESGMTYAHRLRTSDRHPLMFILARYWNVPFITDTLFPEPNGPLHDELLVWTF